MDQARAAQLESLPGGTRLSAALDEVSPAQASEAVLVEVIAATERLASWATAVQARYIQELTTRRAQQLAVLVGGASSSGRDAAEAEIGARLGTTPRAAGTKVALADALDHQPKVADALANGRVDPRKAAVLTTSQPGLSEEQNKALATELLPEADRLTAPAIKQRMKKNALRTAPEVAQARRERAYAERHVSVEPAEDSMSWLTAYIAAEDAERVRYSLNTLTDAARATRDGDGDGDGRTIDQVRADVFTDLFTNLHTGGLTIGTPARGAGTGTGRITASDAHSQRPRRRPDVAVQVTVGAGTLLGLDNEPAVLAGHGPITADLARQLAGDATWRALFTDANGEFTAISTKTYRPGIVLARAVTARETTCTFPGCRRRAEYADLDHITSYDPRLADKLAQTSETNLHPLCRKHHNLKTTRRWNVTRNADGSLTWTATTTGHTYTHHAEPPAGAPPPRTCATDTARYAPPPRTPATPSPRTGNGDDDQDRSDPAEPGGSSDGGRPPVPEADDEEPPF
ncbi:DUF222 domain-containing protein [Georgenia halophila]|uniref:HNH endonuclease signature motif containing protein n=1 Tax=Georgenia halophila TaxID=620889 RepID=UPI0031E5DF9F